MTTQRSRRLAAHPGSPPTGDPPTPTQPILVAHAVDLATAQPPPTTTAKSKPIPPLTQQTCASLDRQVPTRAADELAVDRAGDHADAGHPSHAAACPPPPLHHLPAGHSGRGNPRTPDTHAGHRTPDIWTLRHPHQTPDAGQGHRHADEGTAGIRTSWATMPSGRTLGHPPCSCGQRLRGLATMTARRWATCQHETASRTTSPLLGLPAKPRLGALLSSDDFGSSVGRSSGRHVLWQRLERERGFCCLGDRFKALRGRWAGLIWRQRHQGLVRGRLLVAGDLQHSLH